MKEAVVPKAFIWRRLHSLMGLWIVLFLVEHLLTNSQAALLLGDNGKGFVDMVNWLHNLPYLQVIEITLLGVPLLIHLIWGMKYLLTSKSNANTISRSKPALGEYGRNRAYSWQRITSWILVIGIIGHVTKFRFLDYPDSVNVSGRTSYFVPLGLDQGLYTVAHRLNVHLYDQAAIDKEVSVLKQSPIQPLLETAEEIKKDSGTFLKGAQSIPYDEQKSLILIAAEEYEGKKAWVHTLEKQRIKENQVVGVADNFATATLLVVRDTFKSPIYVGLYTIFVLAACFHAFNGLWTFLITWGVLLNYASQRRMIKWAVLLMVITGFLGLISVWGTYFLNLRN